MRTRKCVPKDSAVLPGVVNKGRPVAKQLKKEQLPGTNMVRWSCEGCCWDMTDPPASYIDVLNAFQKHDCENNEIVFRRGGE